MSILYNKNYFLYTDDAINDNLQNIRLEKNSTIIIDNPMVQAALINCNNINI